MGMHGVAPGSKVLQMNQYDVTNLGSQCGPQEAQPLRSGSQVAVRSIGILPEHSLLINTANAMGSLFQEYRRMSEIEVERYKDTTNERYRHSRGYNKSFKHLHGIS